MGSHASFDNIDESSGTPKFIQGMLEERDFVCQKSARQILMD